ncbi:MAG: hypothetical protein JST48_12075 [Bacteroidetes bacterium]|nr:hypothetical protein [Bacteroidota bacterium]
MKKLIFVFVLAQAISCRYDDVIKRTCYLAMENTTSNQLTYLYDNNNRMTTYSSSGIYSSVLTYDNAGKIISEVDNDFFTITYTYNTVGQLTLWAQTAQGTSYYNLQSKFFYNSVGQDTLIQYFRFDDSTNNYYLWQYTRLTYKANNRNFSKRETFDAGTNALIYTEEFLWDTHPNPYLNNPFFINEPPPTNNAIQHTFTVAGGSPQTTAYTYKYNENGFPVEKSIPGYGVIGIYTYAGCN